MNPANYTSNIIISPEEHGPHTTPTFRLWGLDWGTNLRRLDNQNRPLSITVCTYSELLVFLQENKDRLYNQAQSDGPNPLGENEDFRSRYYNEFADCFAIRLHANDKIIGIGINNILDWQSYYMRYFILLPEFRGQGLFKDYTLNLIRILGDYSVNRVEMDVAPSNAVQIHRINKIGFIMSGMTLSERWGSMVRFTRFINETYNSGFVNQFCRGQKSNLTQDTF